MDGNRFDKLAVSLVDAGSSRRSLLARLVGGGFAAALAALGIGGFSAEDAEARRRAKKRGDEEGEDVQARSAIRREEEAWRQGQGRGKGRRACKSKCSLPSQVPAGRNSSAISKQRRSSQAATPPIGRGTCTVGTVSGVVPSVRTCVLNVAGDPWSARPAIKCLTCTANSQCPTGFCASVGICLPCGTLGTTICGTGDDSNMLCGRRLRAIRTWTFASPECFDAIGSIGARQIEGDWGRHNCAGPDRLRAHSSGSASTPRCFPRLLHPAPSAGADAAPRRPARGSARTLHRQVPAPFSPSHAISWQSSPRCRSRSAG